MTTLIQHREVPIPHPMDEELDEDLLENSLIACDENYRCWESGLKINILEFHGGLLPEEFLDWVVTVEEILEFKEVPKERRVPLIATRFRRRADAWWQQSKLTKSRHGKQKIST